jgi:hypothetical protein
MYFATLAGQSRLVISPPVSLGNDTYTSNSVLPKLSALPEQSLGHHFSMLP